MTRASCPQTSEATSPSEDSGSAAPPPYLTCVSSTPTRRHTAGRTHSKSSRTTRRGKKTNASSLASLVGVNLPLSCSQWTGLRERKPKPPPSAWHPDSRPSGSDRTRTCAALQSRDSPYPSFAPQVCACEGQEGILPPGAHHPPWETARA